MITLEQVKKDIIAGRSTAIYLCTHTLWWTHLDSDVTEATKIGRAYRDRIDEKMLADPNFPEEKKVRIRALKAGLAKLIADNPQAFPDGGPSIPLSPVGAPLTMNNNPMRFIDQSHQFASRFGKHGLKAFMRTHHQNESKHFYSKWDKYNELIDKDLKN